MDDAGTGGGGPKEDEDWFVSLAQRAGVNDAAPKGSTAGDCS